MHNDVYDDLVFKPIIGGLAHLRNWIFATMKLVEIGSKLVFYGSNIFFLGLIGSMSKDYKHIVKHII
jgi:hypothetical protein